MTAAAERLAFRPLVGGVAGSFGSIPSGAAFPSQGIGDKVGQIALNVKDFGAKGDGSTDDTTSIQTAFNAAYGTPNAPNGTNYYVNSRVFFPPGHYIVNSPVSTKTVSNVVDDGTGKFKLTLNSTAGLSTGSRVNVTGVVGAENANQGWTITVNDSTHITLQSSVFTGTYVSGGAVSSFALTLTNVQGAQIFGSGRFTTTIENNTSGGTILATDGFEYSRIESIQFKGTGTGSTALLLDKFTTGNLPVQSLLIMDCYITGTTYGATLANATDTGGAYGQGSEIMFLSTFFDGCAGYGLAPANANSLQVSVINCNFQSCGIGIQVNGACNNVIGTGFQAQADCDIKIIAQADNTMCVDGCRTESSTFINNAAGQAMSVRGCHQTRAGSRGYFYSCFGGMISIEACLFDSKIKPNGWAKMNISNCRATAEVTPGDWLEFDLANLWYTPNNIISAFVEIENCYTILSGGTIDEEINKRRLYTTNGLSITTKNYTVS